MKLQLVLVALLAAACGGGSPDPGDDMPPGDDVPPSGDPTALARCADPARPIAPAWAVDNIRAPLVGLTQIGSTILVSSEDGAVKTWILPAAGGAPSAPSYGTPFIDDGDVVPVLTAAPPGPTPAFAGIDAHGRAHVWGTGGTALRDPIQLVPAAGAYVAVDEHLRWLAGGTAEFGGALTVADLETGTTTGPLATALWNIDDAAIGHGGVLVTVGHIYGCVGIEVRDPRDPATVLSTFDGCHWDGPQLANRIHSVALNPYATEAVVVGDGLYARFDLADVSAGPIAVIETADRYDRVAWSFADDLAFAIGPGVDRESNITIWSTTEDRIVRTTTVPSAIGLTIDKDAGQLITASADGMVRGDRCTE